MDKFEKTMVTILFVALVFWWIYNKNTIAPHRPPSQAGITNNVPAVAGGAVTNAVTNAPALSAPALVAAVDEKKKGVELPAETNRAVKVIKRVLSGNEVTISNALAEVKISPQGGAIVSVTLKEYRAHVAKDSGPVILDLLDHPALVYDGIPGLSENDDFVITRDESKREVRIERTTAEGLRFLRLVRLGDAYQINVTDTFRNESGAKMELPEQYALRTGSMKMIKTISGAMGYQYLGIDSLPSAGGESVLHWANKGPEGNKYSLGERFQPEARQGMGCSPFKPRLGQQLPAVTNAVWCFPGSPTRKTDTDWVAVKNKFFVQILAPKGGGCGVRLSAKREVPETEDPGNGRTWAQTAILEEVWAEMVFYRPGGLGQNESFSNEISYYAGPKQYSMLKQLGKKQDEVMEFGYWLYHISILLLQTLNFLYRLIPNYGVAIILLTLIVRVIFWPITHKSTESMKKMQKIQPLVNEVREKFKDKPQKMNQEVMAIYKEHKVNPMSGCLPILVQIPVFIALFTVLRSAVELRFAEFLWVQDLSEPENLMASIVPIPYGLNLLPMAMAATMFWQQKMTPTAGDPQQQKMLLYMMPIMMLFMFYSMASGLVLYWTVSQCISIFQLYRQKRKAVAEEAAEHAKK
jgi:YidC/Oxa1 family membrane protein insertase